MKNKSKNQGFSLIELMIGITLGLLIVLVVGTILINNSRARQEIEKTNLQIENGRYATQLLLEEIRLAGYYGELNPSSLTLPATLPDPCDNSIATLQSAIALHVQGIDNASVTPACLADMKTGTDIFVVRRTSTCVAGVTGCDPVDTSKYVYFQTALCNISSGQYLIGTNLPTFVLTAKDCSALADLRSYHTKIYFVTNNYKSGDGIPTLRVAELGATGFTISPLVAGIEQFQVEYGMDTNGDGIPDVYSSDPGAYNGCSGVACQTNWRNVVSAKIYILARNTLPSSGFADSHTYVAGGNTYGPYNDAYKRHLYTSLGRLNNVAGRLE